MLEDFLFSMVESARSRQSGSPSDGDVELGSYEGKYPAELFNKSVVIEKAGEVRTVGRVQMEGEDTIVVFGDSGDDRYDIPRSEVMPSGSNLVIAEDKDLQSYRVSKDAPLPPAKSLRPSAEEILRAAREQEQDEKSKQAKATRADPVLSEYQYLARKPRPETTLVARPENYVDDESELSKKLKASVEELRELLFAGTKVAKQKVKVAKRRADEKRARSDAQSIAKMGALALRFSDSFDEILFGIRTRSYAEQEQIYNGFLRLIDSQRDLVVARRNMASRLKDSVPSPVVDEYGKGTIRKRRLTQKSQPALPEKTEGKRTATKTRRSSEDKSNTVESL
jgi:hypothetical protein